MGAADLPRSRERLGFAQAVEGEFAFLDEDYGFHVAQLSPTMARYEGPDTYLTATFNEWPSHELGVNIGLRRDDPREEDYYSIQEIMDLLGVREREDFDYFWADTPERVRFYVGRLADFVRRYASRALIGDERFFGELSAFRDKQTESLKKEGRAIWNHRKAADSAWAANDFEEAARHYALIEDSLTSEERGRLEIARKQLGLE